MQGVSTSLAAIEVSVLSATPAMSTCTWKAPVVQSSAVTLRGRTLRFWKRSSTRASAPGSASATTRRRKRDNSSQYIKPIPHTTSGLSPHFFHPALSEGRAGNDTARVYDRFHGSHSMPASEAIVTPRAACERGLAGYVNIRSHKRCRTTGYECQDAVERRVAQRAATRQRRVRHCSYLPPGCGACGTSRPHRPAGRRHRHGGQWLNG